MGQSQSEIIAEAAVYSAEFPTDLANHLPMVLHAMHALGATPQRLRDYAEAYTRRNAVPLPPAKCALLSEKTWRQALGQRARETDLRAYFTQQVRQHGREAVLAEVLDELADGVAASATHGLMRLAYALLRNDDAEVGAALGYWAATFLALPERPQGMPVRSIEALLADMRASVAFRAIPQAEMLLWHWIDEVQKTNAFRDLIGGVHPNAVSLADLRGAGVALYAGTLSFEALHVVTGAHWIRLVSPFMLHPEGLVARFLDVTLALYPKIGMPELPSAKALDRLRAAPVPSWEEIAARAVRSDDEHDHSLTFSAREEAAFTGDPIYQRLAAMRVGLMDALPSAA